jgi:NADH-quinone oxidoreductase subunit G
MADNGKDKVTLTIDGQTVTVDKGTTVIEAAQSIGIEIPYFCWHPKLDSVGACRMCLVEIEKFPKPAVACATDVMQDMVVHTDSETIVKARRGVIEFLLLNHPLDCPTCDKGGECDLQDNVFKYGIDTSRQTFTRKRVIDKDTHTTFDDKRIGPEIIRNMNRCVTCFKCVRFNKEIAGEYDLGAYQRGVDTVIDAPPGKQIANLYSGNVVEICPVGALTNTDWRYKVRVWLTKTADSISGYDADGQNIKLWYDHRQIFRATSRRNDAVDEGWICDIARYGYQYINAEDRLRTPLIKKQGKQVEATWEEAIDLIARRFKEIKDKKGSVCIAGLAGGNQSTETVYLFNKFFRNVLHSNSVDYRLDYIDLKDGEDAAAYNSLSAAPFVIADLAKADTVFVFASNFIKDHPIVNLWMRKAYRKNNARIFTANPVETKSADISEDELIYRPDTEAAFLAGLLHAVIDNKLYKDIDEGKAAEVRGMLTPASLNEAADICGIAADRITALARALADAKNPYIIAGEYLNATPHRHILANGLFDLANLLGVEDGHAVIPASHADSAGAERVGLRPDIPAHLADLLAQKWGAPLPEPPGNNTSKILKGALREEIDSIFILGANPAVRYPDGPFVNAALDKLDFLVVADLFETATTAKADVVLPLAGWSEQDGSFVNLEGRQQRFAKALPPRHAGIWRGVDIIRKIAEALEAPMEGDDNALRRETEDILAAWKRQPCDRNQYYPVRPPAAMEHEGYPYRLLTGNDLHHYGYLTEHCPSLLRFTSEAYLELSPRLAEKLHIAEGDLVRVESATGRAMLKAKFSDFFEGEVVFVPNNFSATPVNDLVSRESGGWVKIEKLDE